MKYRYLPHTADVKFEVFAHSLEETFQNCLLAVTNLMIEDKKIKPKLKRKIKIKAKKIESLIFDFVNEIIYFVDVYGLLSKRITSLKIEEKDGFFSLGGVIEGDNYKKYEVHGHVKAATYYDMVFEKKKNKYRVVMVLDV